MLGSLMVLCSVRQPLSACCDRLVKMGTHAPAVPGDLVSSLIEMLSGSAMDAEGATPMHHEWQIPLVERMSSIVRLVDALHPPIMNFCAESVRVAQALFVDRLARSGS